ncbi:unnamed protein product [Ixodes pacificus]
MCFSVSIYAFRTHHSERRSGAVLLPSHLFLVYGDATTEIAMWSMQTGVTMRAHWPSAIRGLVPVRRLFCLIFCYLFMLFQTLSVLEVCQSKQAKNRYRYYGAS